MLTRESFIGPWAGLPVAWDENDEFDERTYRADVARSAENGAPGIYTGGTSGEFYAISEDEFKAITVATVDEAHKYSTAAMIGCTATSTRGVLDRIAWAKEAGADAVQVALPFWLAVADHEVVPFFVTVAQAAAPMAFSVYETTRSKQTLTVDQHRAIHDAAPNYLMVKANADTVGCTLEGSRELSEFVNVFVSEGLWAEMADSGVIGGCSATVYANPTKILRMFEHLQAKDQVALQADVDAYNKLYDFAFQAFEGRGFHDSAWDRLVGSATGFLSTDVRCRAPYSAANADDVAVLREWITDHAPEWLWEPAAAGE